MAYAFSKLDDYFRRGKTGTSGGNLERGTSGAPPPTVQAQNLAKTAETSAEQGNAGAAGAYRAAKTADTSGIQSRLSHPAEQQAKNWTTEAEKQAGEYKGAGEQRIGETYNPFNASNVAKAEAGESGATSALQQGLGYTGSELSFQPFQLEAPKLDTSSMLAGGVGGVQAALQKKGGRYTPGMAALDASVIAGNKGALQNLQSKLGGIQQTAREKKTALEGTDEALAAQAKGRADEIKAATKSALESRMGALREAQQAQFAERVGTPQTAEAQRQAMLAQFPAQLDFWANFSGITPEQLASKGLGITPEQFLQSRTESVNVGPSAGQTNLANILGIGAPAALAGQRRVWSMQDPGALYRQNVGLYQQKVAEDQAAAARAAQLSAQQSELAALRERAQQQALYGGGDQGESGPAGSYTGGGAWSGEDYSGEYSNDNMLDWADGEGGYG